MSGREDTAASAAQQSYVGFLSLEKDHPSTEVHVRCLFLSTIKGLVKATRGLYTRTPTVVSVVDLAGELRCLSDWLYDQARRLEPPPAVAAEEARQMEMPVTDPDVPPLMGT